MLKDNDLKGLVQKLPFKYRSEDFKDHWAFLEHLVGVEEISEQKREEVGLLEI